MSFNPGPQKKHVELPFSKKRDDADNSVPFCNDVPITKVNEHKHLGIILDTKLSFSADIKFIISKMRKGIGMLKYLSNYLPRKTLRSMCHPTWTMGMLYTTFLLKLMSVIASH